MARQPKQVTIIARYAHKTNGQLNGTVTYLVRSSNGVDTYCTTLIDGKASGCSCPSKKPCYHMKGLEAREEARWTEYRVALAKKLAAQYVTTQVVEQVAEKLVAPKSDVKSSNQEVTPLKQWVDNKISTQELVKKTTDISRKGNLNTNRAFSLMR